MPELASIVAVLRKAHGRPAPPPPRTAFEWVVWDNVAYLADDERRGEAFEELRSTVGLTPEAIAGASDAALRAVTGHGILAPRFAEKLRAAAERVLAECGGDLDAAVRAAHAVSPARAMRLLRRFPGIGEPGAERILMFMGLYKGLALDSNGLRVLTRLGFASEMKSYDATYRAVRAALDEDGPYRAPVLREAYSLLQTHGRTLCRRSTPECGLCPLSRRCPAAGGTRI